MKHLIKTLLLLITFIGISNAQSITGEVNENQLLIEGFNLTVTVDSLSDLESTFKIEDLKLLIEDTKTNQTISFKIICNGKPMSNGEASYMSYEVSGNSAKSEDFLKKAEKIFLAAKKYYKDH